MHINWEIKQYRLTHSRIGYWFYRILTVKREHIELYIKHPLGYIRVDNPCYMPNEISHLLTWKICGCGKIISRENFVVFISENSSFFPNLRGLYVVLSLVLY